MKKFFLILSAILLFLITLTRSEDFVICAEEVGNNLPETYYLFVSTGCPHCANVEKYFDEKGIWGKYDIKKYDIAENSSYGGVMDRMCAERGKTCEGVPTLIAGADVIVGDVPIINYFEELESGGDSNISAESSGQNQADKQGQTAGGEDETYYLFVRSGCAHCAKVETFIKDSKADQHLNIKILNTTVDRANAQLFEQMCSERSADCGGVPTLIYKDKVITGDQPIIEYFKSLGFNATDWSKWIVIGLLGGTISVILLIIIVSVIKK